MANARRRDASNPVGYVVITLILFAAMQVSRGTGIAQPCAVTYIDTSGNGRCVDIPSKYEPMDVPAIHPIHKIIAPQDMTLTEGGWACYEKGKEVACRTLLKEGTDWTCADKSRVLLTAEDGSKHCILFKGREAK